MIGIKDNRKELKKYRGQWLAYTNKGVISPDRDYRKMKEGIPLSKVFDSKQKRIF